MNFFVCSEVGFRGEGPTAGLAMVLRFVGVYPFDMGLQGGEVTELFWTVAAPEWFGVESGTS